MGRTGAFGYVLYGYESGFKTGAGAQVTPFGGSITTTSDRKLVFGRAQRLTGISFKNNLESLYELGQRQISYALYKEFEGSVTIEWVLSNPWFFTALCGNQYVSNTYHMYVPAKAFNTFQMEVGFDGETSSFCEVFNGCVMNTATITGAAGDVVKVRADVLFAAHSSTTFTSTLSVDNQIPLSFDNAAIAIAGVAGSLGSNVAEVQSFEFTLNNNALGIWGLGTTETQNYVPQALELTGRMSVTMRDRRWVDLLRGYVSGAVFTLGSNSVSSVITVNMMNCWLGDHTFDLEPNTLVVEDLPFVVQMVSSITCTNTVSGQPYARTV